MKSLTDMNFYSQHDPEYKKIKLGTCTTTLYESSCFLTSFCNFLLLHGVTLTPIELNEMCKKKGWFTNGCMFNAAAAAKHFGFSYEKRYLKDVKAVPGICIMETNKYAPKFPQHFTLYDPAKNQRVDPLDSFTPVWEKNDYPIVSYRVLEKLKIDSPITQTTPPVPPVQPTETTATSSQPVQIVVEAPKIDVGTPIEVKVETVPETPEIKTESKPETVEPGLLIKLIKWLIQKIWNK